MIIREEKQLLEAYREIDEEYFKLSTERVGGSLDLFYLLNNIYNSFSSDYTNSGLSADKQYTASLTLVMACQHEFVAATLKSMRGHLVDALQSTRRAIELSAFAKRIYTHPHLANLWIEAGRSIEHYEKYKKKFSNDKLFPKEESDMVRLYERYDVCSKMMHSSIYSMASRIRVEEYDKGMEIKFKYHEIDEDESEPINTLLYIWETHCFIIQMLRKNLTDLTKINNNIWDVRLNSLDASLAVHKSRWKDVIISKE